MMYKRRMSKWRISRSSVREIWQCRLTLSLWSSSRSAGCLDEKLNNWHNGLGR